MRLFNRDNDSDVESFDDQYEAADWDSDDDGVLEAFIHFDSDRIHLDYTFQDVDLDLHVDDGEIDLIAEDGSSDEWRSISTTFDADAADQLAEQLKLAAEMAREGENADIRV